MLKRATRLELRRPYLQESVVLLSPPELREVEQHPPFLNLVRLIRPPQSSARVGAVEDETIDPLRVPGCVLDCDRTALARGQQIKPSVGGSLDDAFEILNPGLE